METKEQKIERLKKEIKDLKTHKILAFADGCEGWSPVIQGFNIKIKKLEQQLKELEKEENSLTNLFNGTTKRLTC